MFALGFAGILAITPMHGLGLKNRVKWTSPGKTDTKAERLWENGGAMGDKRRYDRAFKLEVVHLTRQPGKTVTDVSSEIEK